MLTVGAHNLRMALAAVVACAWLLALTGAPPPAAGASLPWDSGQGRGVVMEGQALAGQGPVRPDEGLSDRPLGWWYRRITNLLRLAVHVWIGWLGRVVGLLGVAVAASMLDRNLIAQWRVHHWRLFQRYVPFAAAVYVLSVFDRRADRLGLVALIAAVIYGIVRRDLIPDTLSIGMLDDVICIGAASRWFMYRCPAEMIERHALSVQKWRERTSRIQARRRRFGRRAKGDHP